MLNDTLEAQSVMNMEGVSDFILKSLKRREEAQNGNEDSCLLPIIPETSKEGELTASTVPVQSTTPLILLNFASLKAII